MMKRATYLSLGLILGASGISVAEIRSVQGGNSIQGGTCPFTVIGDLNAGDLTESPRLFRSDPASTCAAPQPCDGPSGTGPYFYDQYTFVNGAGLNCVTATLTPNCAAAGTFSLHSSAYLNAFVPGATICNDFLGDIGASPADGGPPVSFSFDVPAGATFVVVVNQVNVGATCASYQLDVAGCEVPVSIQDFTVE